MTIVVGNRVEWLGTNATGTVEAISNDGYRAIVRFDDGDRVTIGVIGLRVL